jgi:hypothetical protein
MRKAILPGVRASKVIAGKKVFTDTRGKRFIQERGVDGRVKRVYGDLAICENPACARTFFRRARKRNKHCTTGCEKRHTRASPERLVAKKKQARDEADRLFSLLVRQRDKRCQVPGCRDMRLQCAHVLSRRYFATRWNPYNAMALCVGHHKQYTHDPIGWEEFCIRHLGEELYRGLRLTARTEGYPDLVPILKWLKAEVVAKP